MDGAVRAHIEELVAEEERIESEAAERPMSEANRARLKEIEVELDRQWDLLRGRRARREAGEDPDAVQMRSAEIVESYVE